MWYNLSQEQCYILQGAIWTQMQALRGTALESDISRLKEISNLLYDEGRPSHMEMTKKSQ